MKTFRVTRIAKILSMVSFLLMLALAGFITYLLFTLASAFGNGDISYLPLLSIYSLPFLLLAGLIAWVGIYAIAAQKARLLFNEKSLVFESLNRPIFLLPRGWKPFTLHYDQIKTVNFNGLVGMVEILDTKGNKFVIFPAVFAKNHGEEILIELRRRLLPEVFELGVEISDIIKQWSKTRRAVTVFSVSFLVVYLTTLFFDPMFSSRSWLTDAWHIEMSTVRYQDVWTYSMDTHNNFWVVSWISGGYRVYRFSDQVDSEWMLPDNILQRSYPQFSSADKDGKPIVWLEKGVFHYEKGIWKSIPYKNDLEMGNWDSQGVVLGEQGWAIEQQEQTDRLLKINALNGEWSPLPIPETAKRKNLSPQSMRQAINRDILVLMQGDTEARVYLLSDDKWKSQEYSIILLEGSRIEDYFMDGKDSLWVLLATKNDFIVEKISLNGELQLTQLPLPITAERWGRYNYLVVDSSERLWVGGGYPDFLAVFTPVWKGDAVEIVRYTEDNSNYQSDFPAKLTMLPDGQLWSFGRRIATMDTNLKVLPSPLPEWFASWDWNLIRLFILIPQFFFSIFTYILSIRRISPKKEK